MIWVAMLQAVEKLWGRSIRVSGDDGAVLKHILQIHQVTVVHVLGVVVRVMEVDDALPMGLHDVGGQQQPLAQVPGDLAGHVVPLGGVHHRVLVGVLLLGLLVAALDEAEDLLVGGVALADQRADIAVGDVVLGHLIGAVSHDLVTPPGPESPPQRGSGSSSGS